MFLRSWFLAVLLAFMAGMFEATARTLLPTPWNALRPIFDVAVLFIVLQKKRETIVFTVAAGFLIDLFALGGFSWATWRMPAVIALAGLFYEIVLTNRSLYTALALILIARILDMVLVLAGGLFGELVLHADALRSGWAAFAMTLVWDGAVMTLSFLGIALFTRRLLVGSRKYD